MTPAPAGAETPEHLAALPTPGLGRRALCLVYEVILLFGVALLPAALTTLAVGGLADAGASSVIGQVIGFLCFGLYFIWSWTRRGQTLPMQTWRIRLITPEGGTPGWRQAALRYLLAWLWVAPAIAVAHLAGWNRWWALGATTAWACAYGALALLQPHRQFLHDALCGTRLVQLPPRPRPAR